MYERLFGASANFLRALQVGRSAKNVAAAFLGGYHAALRQLVPSLPEGRAPCLCATESGGAHPRAIQTRLVERDGVWRVTGDKIWVTGADLADLLLVVGSIGLDEQGRNRLRVALVDAHAPGVTLTTLPPTPFIPEIPHAKVAFVDAPTTTLLEGDGYERYLKPFRTVEDAFVFAALAAYLDGRAERGAWPHPFREKLIGLLAILERVARAEDIADPALHVMLAGALVYGHQLANEADAYFDDATPSSKDEWLRDKALLYVAGKARGARTEAAWRRLAQRD